MLSLSMLRRSFLPLALTALACAACQKSKSHKDAPATDDVTAASPVFNAACQAGGGQLAPGATGPSESCTCGAQQTSIADFIAGDYKQDATGHSFAEKCTSARNAQVPPAPTTPGVPSTPGITPTLPGTTTTPLTPAQTEAGRTTFVNACQSLSSAGARYYDQAQGSAEPQCICGADTTTLSFFLADAVSGYLANTTDPRATAFVNACQAAINASVIANGPIGTLPGGYSCKNENDFPTCNDCVIHNWCVLRDVSGRLVAYSDRTAVSDGRGNQDCSNDCSYLQTNYATVATP